MWKVKWDKKRKCGIGKIKLCVHAFSFQSIASKARLAEQQGGEVSGQISRHFKNAVNTNPPLCRPENPHELKIPLTYAFSNYAK